MILLVSEEQGDNPGILPFAIFMGIIIGFPIFYYLIYEPFRILIRLLHYENARLQATDINYLDSNFSFYHSIAPELKARFERRVTSFLRNKRFEGVGIAVTDEMKLFTSACAIQLTFGLRNFWLTEFDNIILQKDSYQLGNYDRKAMGHVSDKGIISLSWNNLKENFKNPADGINVGLHEMAHALYLSSVEKGWDLSFATDYGDYEKEAIIEWKRSHRGGGESFRHDGYKHLYEFFAVCVEYFFERPKDLQAAAPRIFYQMEKLLRLNPLDAVNPVLSEGRILYPPQRIALPQYAPMNLLRKVLSTRKTIFNFIAGTSCLVVAISIFISVLRYQHFHPDEGEMHSFYQFYAMILIFASAMFYIQLSGGDSLSKKEFPDPNPQTARLRSHIFRQIPTRIFASFRNIVWFIIGTACVVIGLYSIYVVINYDIGHSNNSNPYLGFAKLSGFIFLAAMFCYIQVFYVPRKKN